MPIIPVMELGKQRVHHHFAKNGTWVHWLPEDLKRPPQVMVFVAWNYT